MGGSDRLLDAPALRDWAHTAVSDLITHIDEINRLNVFPVADSDTGANMLFTMRSALAEANVGIGADGAPRCVARVASALSVGALNGARGNSGVILSQILRGIADVTAPAAADCGGELPHLDAVLLGAALQRGVELVISSMGGREVSGTIVSVLRAAADAVDECATDGLAAAITAAGDAAVVALEKTPEQLDVLADAGAVDAGGRGLLVLLDALGSTVSGQAPARTVYELSPRAQPAAAAPERPAPQFEVMYGLDGCDAAAADLLRQRLEELGESVAIAAARSDSYSVHVHTDDAGAAVEAGLEAGRLSRIVISALSSGVVGLPAGSWTRERAVLAVVDGDGAAELFAGEGAHVLQPDWGGGRTGHGYQCSPADAGRGRHRCRAGDAAAQWLCGRRRAGRRLHRGHRLGHRRGTDTDGVDGAGAGRAGRARNRAGRRSTTATRWPAPPARPATVRCAWPPKAH